MTVGSQLKTMMTLAGVGTRFVPTDIGAFRYTFRTLVDV